MKKILDNLDPPYKVFYALIYETGMRLKEIRSIKLKDVEPTEWGFRIHIKPEYTKGRTRGARTVAVVEYTHLLAKRLDLHPAHDDLEAFLFPSPSNPRKPVGRNTPYVHLRKAARRVGIKNKRVYNHLLGHTRAAELYPLLRPKEYMRLLGWDSMRMLKIYEHLAEERADIAYVETILRGQKVKREEYKPRNHSLPALRLFKQSSKPFLRPLHLSA